MVTFPSFISKNAGKGVGNQLYYYCLYSVYTGVYTLPVIFFHLPREEFDDQLELMPGLIIEFSTPSGETLPGTILEFDDTSVKVDFNHPLAGETIRYSVKIIDIENQCLKLLPI